MLINGFSVAASLIEKGEDPLLTRTDLANIFGMKKSDLVGARERTGCYSLTRYHLNRAAELLGFSPNDLVYRITPSMLKTDGSGKVSMDSQSAGGVGANNAAAAGGIYNATVTSNTNMDNLVGDLSGHVLGTGFNPANFKLRYDVLMDTAESLDSSIVAALMATLDSATLVRYNMANIDNINLDTPVSSIHEDYAKGIAHLLLGLYSAMSTSMALSMVRDHVTTGNFFSYDEALNLYKWLQKSLGAIMGVTSLPRNEVSRKNARYDKVVAKAIKGRQTLANSNINMTPRVSGDTASETIEYVDMTKMVETMVNKLAEHLDEQASRKETLDGDALIKRANAILKDMPQLIRKS
tara:strand:+ start:66508 stop:67563 length:1056 start_codon:yes stop_codon:yes gene_type:complete